MKSGFEKGNKVFAYRAVEIVNISKMNQNNTEIRIPFFATLMLPDAIIPVSYTHLTLPTTH